MNFFSPGIFFFLFFSPFLSFLISGNRFSNFLGPVRLFRAMQLLLSFQQSQDFSTGSFKHHHPFYSWGTFLQKSSLLYTWKLSKQLLWMNFPRFSCCFSIRNPFFVWLIYKLGMAFIGFYEGFKWLHFDSKFLRTLLGNQDFVQNFSDFLQLSDFLDLSSVPSSFPGQNYISEERGKPWRWK